jgi:Ni,Fe-hydrogenase III component G
MLKTLSLESILGFQTKNIRETNSAFFVSVDQAELEKSFDYWFAQAPDRRPILRGICASPSEESRVFFNLVLEFIAEPKVFCIEVDMPRGKPIKDFTQIWPYANCWMNELEDFSGYVFDRTNRETGIQWRLN